MIVKLQSSLASSDDQRHCLIYNQDRSIFYETSDPDEVKPLLEILKGTPKGYFEAELIDDGNGGKKIQVVKPVEAQNW